MPQVLQKGFTLVELMITILVLGILAAIALPSFAAILERNRVGAVVESVRSDLLWAQSEALKQNCDSLVLFKNFGTSWSYVAETCDADINKFVEAQSDVIIDDTTFPDNEVVFRFRRGESKEDGSILVSSTRYSLEVRIRSLRVVDICSPDPARAVIGYQSC